MFFFCFETDSCAVRKIQSHKAAKRFAVTHVLSREGEG